MKPQESQVGAPIRLGHTILGLISLPSSFLLPLSCFFLPSNPTSPLSHTPRPAAREPLSLIPQPSPEGTYLSSPRPEAALLHCRWLKKKFKEQQQKISFPYLLGIPHIKGGRERGPPIDSPVTGGDSSLGRQPSLPLFQAPKQEPSRSPVPKSPRFQTS